MVERRIAVLVDGDNVGPRHASTVLWEAGKLGRVDVARVYANASRPSDWMTMPGYRVIHAGSGKNAADVLLCIEAMELALEAGFGAFAIASSDRDFTHLAQLLRERRAMVVGLGEKKSSAAFRLACTRVVVLPAMKPCALTPATGDAPSDFDRGIRGMIAQHSRNGRGMLIADLAPKMHAEHGTRISTRPERTWRAYLSARPELYDIDPRGPEATVRFRTDGFSDR